MNNTHEFALYIADLSSLKIGTRHTVKDQDLIHRMVHVLRLQHNDQLVLFSRTCAFVCSLHTHSKKELVVNVIAPKEILSIRPAVHVILPMLKRTALEEALYSSVELGAQTIQLVFTEKTPRTKIQEKDLERYERILISAAEQCKHFCFPVLHAPIALQEALKNIKHDALNIFGDPEGVSYKTILDDQKNNKKNTQENQDITLLVGPEGDLTPEEKIILKNNHFIFVHLTPTILRAQQALTVVLGLIISL